MEKTIDVQLQEALHKDALEKQFVTPDCIYIELSLFKDYELGAALYRLVLMDDQTKAAELYRRVQENILPYQLRAFNDIKHYFPFLVDSNQDVLDIINDPACQDAVALSAPMTTFSNTVDAQLVININHSEVSEKYTKIKVSKDRYLKDFKSVRFVINTFPLVLNPRCRSVIGRSIRNRYSVDVEMISKNPKDFSLKELKRFDEFYTNHLYEFSLNDTFLKGMSDGEFKRVTMFATPTFGMSRRNEYTPEQVKQGCDQIFGCWAVLLRDFKWIPFTHCALKTSDTVTTE